MPDWVEVFVQEAEELLAEVEQCALLLAKDQHDGDVIHRLFRAFHTIKGSSGLCGLDGIAAFTHHVETLLDKVRGGTVPGSIILVDVVLAARDHIAALVAAELGGDPVAPATTEQLVAKLQAIWHGACATECSGELVRAPRPSAGESSSEKAWHIQFRPGPDLLACGGNPALLFLDLHKLGPCEIVAHTDAVPPIEDLVPTLCYLWWDISLRSTCDENAIRDAFIFVEDGSELQIEPAPENSSENLGASGDAPSRIKPPHPTTPAPIAGAPKTEGNKPPETNLAKGLSKESTVRVPSDRLDRLVSLVGELVMNQSRLRQVAAQVGAPELANPVEEIERLISELRDDVLGIRMLPIGTIFGRFRRLVHDLSAELKKDVVLLTEGGDTELDKSILDQLGEPLVHLLRNGIDHGIEPAEERLAADKPRHGTIRLSAIHSGSEVMVRIEDDGRGINRAAVRAKAIETQLLAPDANLSDKELLNLILLPGFSTAREVTNVSGRGVGMDVVKRQIDTMRGSLSITSEVGKGTCVSLCLPLTLAIIDGLLVQVEDHQFILPMSAVTENVELEFAHRRRNNGLNLVSVRGELVPYIDLRQTFQLGGSAPAIEKIVIVAHEGERVGLVVDRVIGTHQTVLQSLGRFFRNIQVTSGATIMGDGRVALILDIPAVVRFVDQQTRAALAVARHAEGEREAIAHHLFSHAMRNQLNLHIQ